MVFEASSQDLSGTTLVNRYFLRRLIGRGGLAVVYEAFDRIRRTPVAIKILRGDKQVTTERLQSFQKDAKILGELAHPNIVRLYEFVHGDGFQFMVMDLVQGEDLRSRIDRQRAPFSPQEVVRILKPVGIALNFAHFKNIYHCDIKPANILLANDGRVLLTDFGVARLAAERWSGGTPPYMSPEQIRDQVVDARTDIYALGVTLFEMLSGGNLPFRGDSPDSRGHGETTRERIEWEHLNLPVPPVQSYNPRVDPRLAAVIVRAMNKNPSQRYAGALEFVTDLEEACSRAYIHSTSEETVFRGELETRVATVKSGETEKGISPPSVTDFVHGLFCVQGAWSGQVFAIYKSPFIIGRSRECQLVIPDPTVSRRHAIIIIGRKTVYIQDAGSKAGTYVDGQRILDPVPLRVGSKIGIGMGWAFEYRKGK
ncbi:MAG: FHA domain-containing serine/threonine-protein kinase [Candidatus Methanomethylicaceae archaeon]